MPERSKRLKEKIRHTQRHISVEQAELVTRSYELHSSDEKILRRVLALQEVANHLTIQVDPEELIIGNRSARIRDGIVFPEAAVHWIGEEWERFPVREQDPFSVSESDRDLFSEKIYPFWMDKTLEARIRRDLGPGLHDFQQVVKINQKDHAQGHIIPDVRTWLRKGIPGLLDETGRRLEIEQDAGRTVFYRSCLIALKACETYILRHAEEAEKVHGTGSMIPGICRRVATSVPRTFHEALQSVWFLFVFLHLESNASSFSFGRLDQLLYPYLNEDLQKGRLNMGSALELIESFYLKCNQIVYLRNSHSARYFAGFPIGFNLAIGGRDTHGDDMSNLLSHLFLRAQEDLGMPQPNLSARIHRDAPESYLEHCGRVIGKGSGMPQIFNDESVIPALMSQGISEEEATDYGVVGCVELSTQGNFLGWSDAAMVNMVKILELTLNGGKCLVTGKMLGPDTGLLTDYEDFQELESAFGSQLEHFIRKTVEVCNRVDLIHQEMLPSPFLSTVVSGCLERGVDVTRGGADHNYSGIQGIQVANLADSLMALKKGVYEQGRVGRQEMLDALRTNYRDREELRCYLEHELPKYGNDQDEVDLLGHRWARSFARIAGQHTNARGGMYQAGFYTVSAHIPMGAHVGATPDGRLAGRPLADGGMSPAGGRDQEGPTAVLNSVSRIDSRLGSNGTLLNMKFLPSMFRTGKDLQVFSGFLRGMSRLNIHHVQFNVVHREDLIRAKEDPESYRNLTIRVAGYTAYFVELAEDLQDEIIARHAFGD